MKILVLAPQWPAPPRQGAAIRNLHIARYLADRHDVSLLAFAPRDEPVDLGALPTLHTSGEVPAPVRSRRERLRTLLSSSQPDMAWRLRSQEMWERVKDLCATERFDAVHVEGIEMAPYGLLALRSGAASMTYDAHNAEYLLQRRAFTTDAGRLRRLPRAAYSMIQWWRLRRFERRTCLVSRHVLAVSQTDAAALARLASRAAQRISVLPNGVDVDYWSTSAGFEDAHLPFPAIVFDGTMDFRPNVDAVGWFVSEVWPRIISARPGARFYIVGRNPAPEVAALARVTGVVVTGQVPDPRPYVAAAAVYVVPMRMGGGVRLKVLQAMAMGRALVSTPMGAEGVAVRDGKHLLLARSPVEFALATLSLLDDEERRRNLGAAARRLVAVCYAWPVVLPALDRIYPPSR